MPAARALVLTAVLVAAACGRDAPVVERVVAVDQVAPSPREPGPSALDDYYDPSFPPAVIDQVELRPGGPPPDGIPAVDDPVFVDPSTVAWLEDTEPVVSFTHRGDARAYPVRILVWHEIVNDTVGGVPVAVTYCPLCNSAVVLDRRAAGRVLDFGTSGLLYQSDLVLYDRQTRSLWVQLLAQAVVGRLAGTELRTYPSATVSWKDWRDANPDGLVLSRDTGFERDYGRNPYPHYDRPDTPAFGFEGAVDPRLPGKERVVGVRAGADQVAIVLGRLRKQRVVELDLGGQPLVALWKPGTASALEKRQVAAGRDVGATGVFEREVDGRLLTFEPDGDRFRDTATNTEWDVLGAAVDGPLAGRQLRRVEHVDTFWFAWAAFVPTTRIVR